MSLSQISEISIEKEQQIQQQIFNAIDAYQKTIFNAGAGAGKTYSLIESLQYIIENRGENLNHHNQNVICITYTNVATSEIKERLGASKLVKVSTIHERLWDLIINYQKQLVEIHTEKLNEELVRYQNELQTDNKFQVYRDLSDKEEFIILMIDNKEVYYNNKDKSAALFREAMNDLLDVSDDLLRNIGNFKSLIGKIYKIHNYQECLSKIGEREYIEVKYDAKYNNDRLYKMMISHDTLLEYAYKIVDRYDLVKQIIIDKYPFILVDEYQDTDERVIKILKLLADYSEQINHNLYIGYFGDTAQNIYDTGVGNKILELHPNLININKEYNRRSTSEIIRIINKIRNDDIVQESIYNDSNGGSIEFYRGNEDDVDSFIEQYKVDWNISQDNKLHCLVLTNELVAKYNKFENIYQKLKSTKYYKTNWENINTEILNNDLSKLGNIPSLFYRLIDFIMKIENSRTSIIEIVNEKIYKELTFIQLKELIELLKSIDRTSVKVCIESIISIYNETDNESYKKIIKELLNIELFTFTHFLDYMLSELFPHIEDSDIENSKEKLIELLEVDSTEYIDWFNFINKVENKEVIYHTYHGTKGEEYKNVIIIMQNSFGRDRNKFSSYFTNCLDTSRLNIEELEKFTNTKNLLYVSCSRAINNLRIIYLDDISDFESNIETLFDRILNFRRRE